MKKAKIKVVAHFKKNKINNKELVGIQWIRSEKEGSLYYLKNKDLSLPVQFWQRQNDDQVKNLHELKRIKTKHEIDTPWDRGRVSYASPLYCEIINQIPEEYIENVEAFEVLVDNFKEIDDDFDEVTTILYSLIN